MTRVALVQMNSVVNVATNQQQIEAHIHEAAGQGAELILLPEMCLSMDADKYQGIASSPQILNWFSDLSKTHRIWLVAGAVPQPVASDSTNVGEQPVHSALLVFNPEGEQVARYNKVHLFDVEVSDPQGCYRESDRFAAGDQYQTLPTPLGHLGLSICFDLRFPDQFQAMREAGAEIMLVPAAFTHKTGEAHWEVLLRARAIETQCYLLAANQCGWHDDKRQTYGHSMIIDPWGKVIAKLDEEPGVVITDLNLSLLQDIRTKMPLRSKPC